LSDSPHPVAESNPSPYNKESKLDDPVTESPSNQQKIEKSREGEEKFNYF